MTGADRAAAAQETRTSAKPVGQEEPGPSRDKPSAAGEPATPDQAIGRGEVASGDRPAGPAGRDRAAGGDKAASQDKVVSHDRAAGGDKVASQDKVASHDRAAGGDKVASEDKAASQDEGGARDGAASGDRPAGPAGRDKVAGGDKAASRGKVASQDKAASGDEAAASADGDVTVVPGIARYHRPTCILIRFLGADDLETMTRRHAQDSGCVPCRACQPDSQAAAD